MYNCDMKKAINLKNVKKYGAYVSLVVLISVLFSIVSYGNLNNLYTKKLTVEDNHFELLEQDIINYEDSTYISIDVINQHVGHDIYVDKASRKLILTNKDKVIKYELNSNIAYVNLSENVAMDSKMYVRKNNIDYINIDEVAREYGYSVVFSDMLNTIDFVSQEQEKLNIKHTRIYGYIESYKSQKIVVTSSDVCTAIKDEEYYSSNSKYYTVIVENSTGKMVVKCLKKDFEEVEKEIIEIPSPEYDVYTLVSNEDGSVKEIDGIQIIQGLKLQSKLGDISVEYNKNIVTEDDYLAITNGYKAANFDNSICISMLQSDTSRENLIKNIAQNIGEAKGIVINFRELKSDVKEYFSQFIKEISSYMHTLGKETLVYVPNEATYVDVNEICDHIDYIIYMQYGTKNLNSKVSGATSSISDFKKLLNNLNENVLKKVIIEIPLYSILWVEKDNKIVNSEIVYTKVFDEYISQNNLTKKIEEISGQNYVEHQKGSLKYRMWLNDKYSYEQKLELAKEYKIAGICLYKNGYGVEYIL